jgi:hypothetical protein
MHASGRGYMASTLEYEKIRIPGRRHGSIGLSAGSAAVAEHDAIAITGQTISRG